MELLMYRKKISIFYYYLTCCVLLSSGINLFLLYMWAVPSLIAVSTIKYAV